MKPVFVINTLSETVAKKGSKLSAFQDQAAAIYDQNIFDTLDDITRAGIDAGWVIIEGGDGTAQGIISAFLNRADDRANIPKFTLLPGGMTNQVAKNIGLKRAAHKRLSKLFSGENSIAHVPLIQVAQKGHAAQFGFLFSTGGVPMVTEYTKAKLHSKGIGGSSAVLGGIIRGVSGRNSDILYPTDISLKADDIEVLNTPHLGTLVTTLPSLIMGLDPFWGAGDKPLRVTAVSANPKKLASHAAGLWAGRKHKDRSADGLSSWTAHQLDYFYTGPAVLDGERLEISGAFTLSATAPLEFIT